MLSHNNIRGRGESPVTSNTMTQDFATMYITYMDKTYEQIHGNPFDRGSADSYYSRPREPHYFPNGTGHAPRISEVNMTAVEVRQYDAGYSSNERDGFKK